MDIPLDEVIYFDACSSASTGAAADADSTPTFEIFEEATDTDIGVGGNMTKRTSKTGQYRGTATLSAANGFEVGKWYAVWGYATIGGIATKGILKHFRVVAAEAIAGKPKVDIDALLGTAWLTPGVAGTPDVNTKLWGGSATPVTNINTIYNTDYATLYDTTNKAFLSKLGNFAMGGSSLALTTGAIAGTTLTLSGAVAFQSTFVVTGATTFTGAITATNASNNLRLGTFTVDTNAIAWPAAWDAEVQSECADALVAYDPPTEAEMNARTLAAASYATAAAQTTAQTSIDDLPTNTELATSQASADDATLAAIAALNNITAASVWAVGTRVLTAGTNIDGSTFAAIPWNASWDAEVQSEVDDALAATVPDSIPADGTRPSVQQAVYMLVQLLTEGGISGTTWTVRKPDGTSTLFTVTLDSATTPTSKTRAT